MKIIANKLIYMFCILIVLLANHSCSSDEEISKYTENKYELHFIDVGQGDAILITTPGKTILVDAGDRNSNTGRYLLEKEIEGIDIVIATHPHADHIGGLIEIFETFDVSEVIDPGVSHTTITYDDYINAIEENDILLTVGKKGMERNLGEDSYLKILHPPDPIPDYTSSYLNNISIVAKVTFDEVSVLLTGDIEKEAESDLLSDPGDLPANILKVAHHGSASSSTMDFLQEVEPEISIIMCGEDNQYGHPHDETLNRLEEVGTEIYRTDIHGHIIVESCGKDYNITTTYDRNETGKIIFSDY